jgi:hypothetical protein
VKIWTSEDDPEIPPNGEIWEGWNGRYRITQLTAVPARDYETYEQARAQLQQWAKLPTLFIIDNVVIVLALLAFSFAIFGALLGLVWCFVIGLVLGAGSVAVSWLGDRWYRRLGP